MGGECDDESGEIEFPNQAEMNTMSMPLDSVYRSSWDPMVSLNQSASFFGVSSTVSHDNYSINNGSNGTSSQREDYSFGLKFDQISPEISLLESGSIPEFVVPYGYPWNKRRMSESLSVDVVPDDKGCQVEGNDVSVSLGKRKRNQDAEKDQHGHSGETFGTNEDDNKRQKKETNEAANSSATQASEQPDTHQAEEARKQNYVHVRAKRGQATNSHSLAERARREKISERMRLLQELVPGCNKITGKAVMLDEIINYVQSLQHQVEFLSMKLAAVSPDLSLDTNQVVSKDFPNSGGNNSSFIGLNQAMSSSHGLNHGLYQGNLTTMPNAAAQYHHYSQVAWDDGVQNLLHMGPKTEQF